MSVLTWLQIVAEIVAEFAVSNNEQEYLTRKFRTHADYMMIRGQYSSGATDRRVRQMIRRTLGQMT